MGDEKSDEQIVLDRVTPRFGSAEAAIKWFEEEPLPGLSGATAKQLVVQGRVREILDYIDAIDEGGYA
ncbi:hypothetical protein GCM10008024_30380 [Allgaiera indica]|uniref:Antitoxin Xre/MbcA/ParS-like toxin-binding domain-containing protein n=1 Tax=Allgaiera indica TaxID=765699 RepID=A0AAN4UTN9_9RHOB|nr:MbcA/ParS/Xre antitoxin family protein [Allgaiera indica]GHE04185.1 hypothetical protein GCM10008024_30380 [Allgaiera indica]SDX50693.1 Protein of unknown function [Allgaiera indica]